MSWDEIEKEWRGKVPKAAIAEAVELASHALQEKTENIIQLNKQAA